jgi:hypothetical protein
MGDILHAVAAGKEPVELKKNDQRANESKSADPGNPLSECLHFAGLADFVTVGGVVY